MNEWTNELIVAVDRSSFLNARKPCWPWLFSGNQRRCCFSYWHSFLFFVFFSLYGIITNCQNISLLTKACKKLTEFHTHVLQGILFCFVFVSIISCWMNTFNLTSFWQIKLAMKRNTNDGILWLNSRHKRGWNSVDRRRTACVWRACTAGDWGKEQVADTLQWKTGSDHVVESLDTRTHPAGMLPCW